MLCTLKPGTPVPIAYVQYYGRLGIRPKNATKFKFSIYRKSDRMRRKRCTLSVLITVLNLVSTCVYVASWVLNLVRVRYGRMQLY